MGDTGSTNCGNGASVAIWKGIERGVTLAFVKTRVERPSSIAVGADGSVGAFCALGDLVGARVA